MKIDELQGYSKEEYAGLVSTLIEETATKLVSVRGSADGLRAAIADYIHRGMRARLPSGQLVCSFCLHSPSVLDRAAFPAEERDMITKLFYDLIRDVGPSYETKRG